MLIPVSKIFESILAKSLIAYLESKNLLKDEQFGFHERRSCEIALSSIVEDWCDSLNN